MTRESVTDHFGHDHQRLDRLLRKFETMRKSDRPAVESVFIKFKAGLERHIRWEEEILFPIFEAKMGLRYGGPTEVMRVEHRQIQRLLAEIAGKLARQEPSLESDVSALLGLLATHNQKEEHILYPAIDRLLSAPEHDAVFAAMQRN